MTSWIRSRCTPHHLYCLPVKAHRKPRPFDPHSPLLKRLQSMEVVSGGANTKAEGHGDNRLCDSFGGYTLGRPQGVDNTTLRRWQFEDQLRALRSQRTALHCSSLGNFCLASVHRHVPPLSSTFSPLRGRQEEVRIVQLFIFNGSWALAILRETSRETSY